MISVPELYSYFLRHPHVCTDTRTLTEKSIYFALRGGNFNGNKFASQAIENGASYAIIDEKEYLINEKTILVHDVLTTLQDLAKYHRQQLKTVVIALTGSNGKTTTKELLHRVLSSKYETLATIGNLNNHIGVPLTLLRIEKKHAYAIIEMGANHRNEIEALCNMALPNFGLITNIGKAHLEGFGGEKGVAQAKTELYYYLYKNKGIAFVNLDEEATSEFSAHNECIYFSTLKSAYKKAKLITVSPTIEFELEGKSYVSVLSGDYNFRNIVSAIAIGIYFGVAPELAGTAIASYIPQNMRHQWISWKSNKVLLDAYNANPDSMYNALKNFNLLEAKNKIVILGDMFELGIQAKDEHQIIVNSIEDYEFEEILVCGKCFAASTLLFGVKAFEAFEELQAYFLAQSYQNKTILIKGSRGMQLERLVND